MTIHYRLLPVMPASKLVVRMEQHSVHQVAPFYHPITKVKHLSVDTETAIALMVEQAQFLPCAVAKSAELPAPQVIEPHRRSSTTLHSGLAGIHLPEAH